MEMGVETPERGIAMDFPVSEGAMSCSPPKMPTRLLRRMSEPKTSTPSTIEEIEAKLRHAHLRRQVTTLILLFFLFLISLQEYNLFFS